VVYLTSKSLDKHCIGLEPNLDKKRIVHKKAAFAQLVLWISSRFSTEEVQKVVFLLPEWAASELAMQVSQQ
jgi:hypothetical protein